MSRRNESIGTFSPNRQEPIHRWYPYIEGYASSLVENELLKRAPEHCSSIYDPFAGTGTTAVVASENGIASYYSETNPFMRTVIETKINSARRAVNDDTIVEELQRLQTGLPDNREFSQEELRWDGFEKYFQPQNLAAILSIKDLISEQTSGDAAALAMLALSAILVPASKMTRRGDLRFARESELSKKPADVLGLFQEKLAATISDIENHAYRLNLGTSCIAENARDLPEDFKVDLVITSPPYLNGTNYIRNTKLELKLNDYIATEADLPALHSKGVVAGINNVTKRAEEVEILPEVEKYYEALKPVSYDKRIPKMVANYFGDMNLIFNRLAHSLKVGGYFVMDIGDSQFAGIHVPTDKILIELAAQHGFSLDENEVLRTRRSRNGMALTQRIIRFRLEQ